MTVHQNNHNHRQVWSIILTDRCESEQLRTGEHQQSSVLLLQGKRKKTIAELKVLLRLKPIC